MTDLLAQLREILDEVEKRDRYCYRDNCVDAMPALCRFAREVLAVHDGLNLSSPHEAGAFLAREIRDCIARALAPRGTPVLNDDTRLDLSDDPPPGEATSAESPDAARNEPGGAWKEKHDRAVRVIEHLTKHIDKQDAVVDAAREYRKVWEAQVDDDEEGDGEILLSRYHDMTDALSRLDSTNQATQYKATQYKGGPPPSGWVKCSERLPEVGALYYTFEKPHELSDEHGYDLLWYFPEAGTNKLKGWRFNDTLDEAGTPTHWQPLPPPPAREGGAHD